MDKRALELISTNVNVGIDEVISVFVSRFETDLFNKKEDLSEKIKTLKGEQESLVNKLKGSVPKAQYEQTVPVLNISSEVQCITVDFTSSAGPNKAPSIKVELLIKDMDRSYNGYRTELQKTIYLPITKEDLDKNTEIENRLSSLNAELLEVLGQIKSMGRKERQIRGRISEMKLNQSGYSDLLQNDELLKLVQIK